MDSSFAPDVLAEDEHAGIYAELVLESAAHGRDQIDARTLRARLQGARRRHQALAADAALLLQFNGAIGCQFRKKIAPNAPRVGSAPPFDGIERIRDGLAAARDLEIPVGSGDDVRHQLSVQPQERIVRFLGSDFACALICLGVLSRVPGKPRHQQSDQRRAPVRANARDCIFNQRRRSHGV